MVTRVLVVGGGVSGTAASLAARKAGAHVHAVWGPAGASTLTSGALHGAQDEMTAEAAAVLETLGLHRKARALLATVAGTLREAAGYDAALLDLGAALPEGGIVFVPRSTSPGWDADLLARAWSETGEAQGRRLRFMAGGGTLLRFTDEDRLPDADLAARHDDPARVRWLADRLKEDLAGLAEAKAVLLPPWLGLVRPQAVALSRLVGVPCGEIMSSPGGPAGLRFDRHRDEAFTAAGVETIRGWVAAITATPSGFVARLEGGPIPGTFHAVVLATGGLLGGGLRYEPSEARPGTELPAAPSPSFRVTLDAQVLVGQGGHPLGIPGSLFGVAPESLVWPFVGDGGIGLDVAARVGVLSTPDGSVRGGPPGLFVAGELEADQPRGWLDALVSGARAGSLAAHFRT